MAILNRMLQKLTASDLFHDYVKILLAFERLNHAYDIGVPKGLHYLYFLVDEFPFFLLHVLFINNFHRKYFFTTFSLSTLVNSRKFTDTDLFTNLILIFKVNIIC